MQKTAIFDEDEQLRIFSACESDREFVPIWLMMRCGIHPSDLSFEKLRIEGRFLLWKRAKNANPRREMIPDDIMPKVKLWLARGKKLTRQGYNRMVSRVCERIGHPEYSPMTMRHTFCLQELRRLMRQRPPPPDFLTLVAKKMGCSRDVVAQNYIDLMQWESLGGEGEQNWVSNSPIIHEEMPSARVGETKRRNHGRSC